MLFCGFSLEKDITSGMNVFTVLGEFCFLFQCDVAGQFPFVLTLWLKTVNLDGNHTIQVVELPAVSQARVVHRSCLRSQCWWITWGTLYGGYPWSIAVTTVVGSPQLLHSTIAVCAYVSIFPVVFDGKTMRRFYASVLGRQWCLQRGIKPRERVSCQPEKGFFLLVFCWFVFQLFDAAMVCNGWKSNIVQVEETLLPVLLTQIIRKFL